MTYLTPMSYNSLLEILTYRAQYQPDKQAYIFLQDGEVESGHITYRELDKQARVIASHLQSFKEERALLLYHSGIEFITAFFGCLYAGVIAVPAYPPRRNQKLSRLLAIVNDAQPKVALTNTSILTDIEQKWTNDAQLAQLKLVATDIIESQKKYLIPITPTSDSLAFLQYTSGSTEAPKGVMVTHGNIIHNQEIIKTAFGHSEKSIGVGWLPLFHDMGLIGHVLQPIYVGFPSILMPPVAFLQKPIRWLKAISKYKATTSGGPNFAYDLCVKKIQPEELDNLDFSCWDLAFNGAEPLRAETLEQFSQKFAACNFNKDAFLPCYGMAETTLFTAGGSKNKSPVIVGVKASDLEQNLVVETEISSPESRVFVGCGHSYMDTNIIIVNPDSLTRCSSEQVGEIWISSDSVAAGYWNRSEATKENFQAYTKDTRNGLFLRTGDLGFLKNGELFVTGRLKDLIIIRGRNYYPQDIELTVENSHPSLRSNFSAAFTVEIEGEERLVVACEVERTYIRKLNSSEVIKEIQIAVSTEHELEVYGVLLLKTGSIPKTSSGKIQRRGCKQKFLENSLNLLGKWQKNLDNNLTTTTANLEKKHKENYQNNHGQTVGEIEIWLTNKIAQVLEIAPADIDLKQPFAVYGLDSVKAVSIAGELEEWLGISIAPTIVYDYPTPRLLANYLGQKTSVKESKASQRTTESSSVAIIGKGCRFPASNNPHAFWSKLTSATDAITQVPIERWQSENNWGGFLEQIDQFDAQFFNLSPRETINIDPQQRLLLEVSWEALENAGLAVEQLAGIKGGVFIGISSGDYAKLNGNKANTQAYYATGNALSIAANRLSYFLDWHGPSLALDTACSSSLVAVHQACQSLLAGESEIALAGGVNLILTPQLNLTFSEAGMMSVDGRCKTFDAEADGYVRGEGCGVVVLKRLNDAIRDGDNIQAIIRGSAVNQDGLTNGLTAPNGNSQQEVVRLALAKAGVKPNQISYVETHGTGTSLGDPIEVNSLKEVLTEARDSNQPCWIGSVKTNIGHLEAAAGIAGLIKVVLQIENQEIPPHLHLKQLNPYIKIENSNIHIPTSLIPWQTSTEKRLAGVSSFGFGGTNAHVIVQEAPLSVNSYKLPVTSEAETERPLHLLTLSAKSEYALKDLVSSYQSHIETHPSLELTDICFTANTGRSHFNHRLAIIASEKQELIDKLALISVQEEIKGVFKGQLSTNNFSPKIAFLFTGQGSQYINMGRQLYETQSVFRETVLKCNEILKSPNEKSILDVIYPENHQELDNSIIDQTAYTQPALFTIEYALYKLWESWGIRPSVVMGHSVGEYVAATVAGVFSLEDGLKLIAHRGRLMQQLPPGGEMLSIMASYEQVNQLITPYSEKVTIAGINGPQSVVISGESEAVAKVKEIFDSLEIKTKQLQVSHAFHSHLMSPMLGEFTQLASEITYNQPQIPLISNITGARADDSIATATYWVNHVSQPVQFAQSMETLHQEGYQIFLEIGPKPILLGMGRQCLPEDGGVWLPSLRPGKEDNPHPTGEWQQMLQSLGELYVRGVKVDWLGFDKDYPRSKIVLPTYPFQRQRYWIESTELSCQKYEALYETLTLPKTDLPFHIFCLSASSEQELFGLAKNTLSTLKEHSEIKLSDICFLANTKQLHLDYRLAVIVESKIELQRSLSDFLAGKQLPNLVFGNSEITSPKIVFLFSGHSSQYVGMGKELYETQPIFRKAFDDCEEILKSYVDESLYEILYSTEAEKYFRLERTENSYLALFALQYALVKLWKSWGIEPAVVLGASAGDYAAACYAGVFNLEDGLKLITTYGRLMETLPPINKTIGVITSEEKLAQIIQPYANEISIISYGGSNNLITGPSPSVEVIIEDLKQQGIRTIGMPGDPYGCHTHRVEAILENLNRAAQEITYHSPQVNFLSSILGEFVTTEVAIPEYWLNNMRQPVKLSTAFGTLFQLDYRIFVEIGPQAIVLGTGRQCFPKTEGVWLPSLRKRLSDWKQMLLSLGELYVRGVSVNWEGSYQCYPQHQVSLPKNIFADNYQETNILRSLSKGKIEEVNQLLQATGELSNVEKKLAPKLLNLLFQEHQKQLNLEQNLDNLLYELEWKTSPVNLQKFSDKNLVNTIEHWLIFADYSQVGENLAQLLQNKGHVCTLVYPDKNHSDREKRVYGVKPNDVESFQILCQEIKDDSPSAVIGIIHLWSLNTEFAEELTPSNLEKAKILGCGSVLYILQALTTIINFKISNLWLITKGCQSITANSNNNSHKIQLQQTPLWGLGKAITLEHPEYQCRCLDLSPQFNTNDSASILLEEILNCDVENQIAYQQKLRHVARLIQKQRKPKHNKQSLSIQENSSYLITGGLGTLGLELAQYLVERGAKNIVLTSRRKASETAQKNIQKLVQKGAKISVLLGDISQEQDVAKIIQEINSSLPPLKGVIHAAGIINDGLLQSMNWSNFVQVLAPKVDGSWYLHQFTQNINLDFFVCFSSIASLLGSPGQGNYAAANAFMDALAHHRQSMGLPGLSINWGPWSTAGMAANLDNRYQSRMLTMGITPLGSEQGLQIFGQLLGQSVPQVGVSSVEWSLFHEQLSSGNQIPLLSELVEVKPTEKKRHQLLEQLQSVSEDDRQKILTDYIKVEVARVLGMTASQINVQQPLNTMGLDSLMAVELKNWLQGELAVDIPIVKFIEDINIVDLATDVNLQLNQINANQGVELENNEQLLLSDLNDSNWVEGEL